MSNDDSAIDMPCC